MLIIALLGLLLLGSAAPAAASDSYSVHLEPATIAISCDSSRVSQLRDFTYRFRGRAYPLGELSLRNGNNTETDRLGGVEWITSLEQQQPIELNGTPALLAVVFSNHVGGSGSVTHLLVVRCRNKRLEVVFEAGGEGIHPSLTRSHSYAADRGLRVAHAVWLPTDPHCCPSREIVETYRWQPKRERFVLLESHGQPISTE